MAPVGEESAAPSTSTDSRNTSTWHAWNVTRSPVAASTRAAAAPQTFCPAHWVLSTAERGEDQARGEAQEQEHCGPLPHRAILHRAPRLAK